MSKHRRPSPLVRLRTVGHSPLQLSIAAGVAGTVAVTGTVVASAADSSTVRTTPTESPALGALVVEALGDSTDLGNAGSAQALRSAVDEAQRARAERLAAAKVRALAKRQAEKRAAERRAEKRAAEARSSSAASRGVERMSASAANVLRIAAQAASGAYYSYGASGPGSFDCSGFTSYVFDKVGISLPHSSSAQRGMVRSVSSPQPGDLVFVYNGGGGSIGHVAIYAGGGYWWEAANPSTGVGKHRAWSSAVSYGRVL